MVILRNKNVKKYGQNLLRGLLTLMIIGVVTVASVTNGAKVWGYTSSVCQKSAECMAAVEAEKKANAAAVSASASADYYQTKVNSLSMEVASIKVQIADTKAQVDDLNKQIKETEENLESEQNALAELLVNMHFESDAEPIRILAGSTSISDLAEKQARAEVAKEQIGTMASNIKEDKEKLENDKAQVENLLAEQEKAKQNLEKTMTEQADLVAKFQNDAKGYEEQVIAARNAQKAAMDTYRQQHPEETGVYYDGIDTYKSYIYDLGGYECPRDWDRFSTTVNGKYIGGFGCECVSYVGWKAYERYGLYLAWGNAYNWDDVGRKYYAVDHNPTAGSIGQFDAGQYGHVFWVESVNGDGSIDVTDYNYNVDGRFTARTISAAAASRFNYIHIHN